MVQPLSLPDTGHGCHAQRNMRHGCSFNARTYVYIHMHACIHTCTHLGGCTDVDTSSACAHTTRVSNADNRNNKHKQVVRPYKCMSQCRSNNNNTSGCASYKTRKWKWQINKTKQNKHTLEQRTLSLSTSRWLTTRLGYMAYYYPTAAGSLCW